jgi:hypothetical protein
VWRLFRTRSHHADEPTPALGGQALGRACVPESRHPSLARQLGCRSVLSSDAALHRPTRLVSPEIHARRVDLVRISAH